MMYCRPSIVRMVTPAAIFVAGCLHAASADVVNLYNLDVTLNGITVFTDNFSTGTLNGGSGTVLPAGPTYSNGSTALYQVIGTLQETGAPPTSKAVLDTALGAQVTQTGQFSPVVKLNVVTLLTGPPGAGLSNFPLTQTAAFSTSALFDVTPPATVGGFYQVNLSNRVPSNNFEGDVLSMSVFNCTPAACPGFATGHYIQLVDANAVTGVITTHDSVPLDTSNQQVLLELINDPSNGVVDGYYRYFNNGAPSGPLTLLGSYGGLFGSGPGQLTYTQAGFVQLAPVPEPSSFTLLVGSITGVVALTWRRRRHVSGLPKL
jgi:hypothetical protein